MDRSRRAPARWPPIPIALPKSWPANSPALRRLQLHPSVPRRQRANRHDDAARRRRAVRPSSRPDAFCEQWYAASRDSMPFRRDGRADHRPFLPLFVRAICSAALRRQIALNRGIVVMWRPYRSHRRSVRRGRAVPAATAPVDRRGSTRRPHESQAELLRLVGRQPGISVREAATELGLVPNTASTLVSKLAADGLLIRSVDADDRRVGRLRLTEPAQRIADESRRRAAGDAGRGARRTRRRPGRAAGPRAARYSPR